MKLDVEIISIGTNANHSYDRRVITEEGYDKFKKMLAGLNVLEGIEEGKKVYFEKQVVFPKTKFKKNYPKNKIVFKVEDADILVVREDVMDTRLFSLNILRAPNGAYYYNERNALADGQTVFDECTFYNVYESQTARLDEIGSYEGKDIIYPKSINFGSDNELDKVAFSRLDSMLSASDTNTIRLGMNLLTTYDYNKYKHKLLLLYHRHYIKWNGEPSKLNIEGKELMRRIKNEHNVRAFLANLHLDYPDDEDIKNDFDIWLANQGITRKVKFQLDE